MVVQWLSRHSGGSRNPVGPPKASWDTGFRRNDDARKDLAHDIVEKRRGLGRARSYSTAHTDQTTDR